MDKCLELSFWPVRPLLRVGSGYIGTKKQQTVNGEHVFFHCDIYHFSVPTYINFVERNSQITQSVGKYASSKLCSRNFLSTNHIHYHRPSFRPPAASTNSSLIANSALPLCFCEWMCVYDVFYDSRALPLLISTPPVGSAILLDIALCYPSRMSFISLHTRCDIKVYIYGK